MKLATALTALLFAPVVIEALPKPIVDTLATLTMGALCLTLVGLFFWVGLKK